MATGQYPVNVAADDTAYAGTAETYADFGSGSVGKCAYWKAEIRAFDKDEQTKEWRKRGTQVVDRYRDKRVGISGYADDRTKKYNMLWSIVNTTMPAVYSRPPTPIVMRRFTDPDQVARVASIILERVLDFQLCFQSDFHPSIKHALQDRLLPGMGVVWVRYQKAQESPTGTIDDDYYAKLSGELAAVDYVYWEDFGWVSSRTWEEVPALWRIVYMTRDELCARFGDDIGERVPLDYTPARHPDANQSTRETDEPKSEVFKQAKIYEVWDKRTSTVCWLSMRMADLLDEKDDPMGFPGFFPCPKPLFATNTTGNLIPQPDYCMYQDQAREIDAITNRLDYLIQACKVVGVYDQSQEGIQRIFTEGLENQLIPIDTWAAFADKGGIKGSIDWVPLDTVIEVIQQLYQARQQMIQDIYQITGISDIVRGASNPHETLGAQQIKTQFTSVRLDAQKQELARFVTDVLKLMGHVAVRFFDIHTLIAQSAIMQSPDGQKAIKEAQAAMAQRMMAPPTSPGVPMSLPGAGPSAPPPGAQPLPGGMLPAPPSAGMPAPPAPNVVPWPAPLATSTQNIVQQAIQLLRAGQLADYRIEIASDSLIEPDLDAQRDATNAFITGVTQFLQQAIPAVEANPQIAPIAQSLLMFGIRNFRVGRDIEGVIESAFEQMRANPPPPKPDPKVMQIQAQQQSDAQDRQAEMQLRMAEIQGEMQRNQEEAANERLKMQGELEAFREKTMAEVQAILIQANVKQESTRQKMVMDAESQAAQQRSDVLKGAQDMAISEQQHQQGMRHQAESNAVQAATGPKILGPDGQPLS